MPDPLPPIQYRRLFYSRKMLASVTGFEASPKSTVQIPSEAVLVPCRFNLATGFFEPLVTVWEAYPHLSAYCAASNEEKKKDADDNREGKLSKWSIEEDERLMIHVETLGKQAWAQISRELNCDFHNDKVVRQGKHCRERWYNHLDPSLKSKHHSECEWSKEEDQLLLSLHKQHGNCWSKIARKIQGRTENHVKNRWHSLVKRAKGGEMSALQPDSQILRPIAIPPPKVTINRVEDC